jgi:hypothetical protein
MTEKFEQKPIVDNYPHLIAKSGEIFYMKDNKLCYAANAEDYQKVISLYVLRQKAQNFYNTYFTYKVSGMLIHSPIRNKSYITKQIKDLPIDKQLEVFENYSNIVLSAEPEVASLQGEFIK